MTGKNPDITGKLSGFGIKPASAAQSVKRRTRRKKSQIACDLQEFRESFHSKKVSAKRIITEKR